MQEVYDVVIIGGGPAGTTAALYCARYALKTLIISPNWGGQILDTNDVENYPGFTKITGPELAKKFKEQIEFQGVTLKTETVKSVEKKGKLFLVKTQDHIYTGKVAIYCVGSRRRELNVKGEEEFKKRGVSYCATCDAAFYKNLKVAVVGSGNSAAGAAMLLAKIATEVTILIRSEKMKCEALYLKQIENDPKIKIINNVNITEVKGDQFVTSAILSNGQEIAVDGIFIEIGFLPDTTIIQNLNPTKDNEGYIKINERQETSIEGLLAAGDITTGSNKFAQLTTACSEGTIAAQTALEYLQREDA